MPRQLIAGRYRMLEPVGRGGMGTVWLCLDEVLDREVAVKQLGLIPGETAAHVARAMREARIAAALNHPNAVSIFDVVQHEDAPWLVMEYLPSRTLSAMVADGPLPPERVARIGSQVAAALASAHELGIMHRDVKPGNVLVADGDQAKISDFGISRYTYDERLTQTGLVTGTPAYFSPEQARGQEATPASDVWALGATLYAAVEGRTPYPSQTNPLAVLQSIVSGPPDPPTRAGPLQDVLAGMMHRDPDQRWTMAEAERSLRAVAEGRAEQPTTAFAASPAPAPADIDDVDPQASDRDATVVGASAGRPAAGPDREDGDGGADRGRRVLMVVLAVALVVLLGGIGYLMLAGDSGGGDPTAEEQPQRPQRSESEPAPDEQTPSESPSPQTSEPSPQTSEPSPEPTTRSPAPGGNAPAGDAVRVVTDYFAALPDDEDQGWRMLSSGMRQEVGSRGDYEGFWDTIDEVSVSDARVVEEDPTTVRALVTYVRDDGTVVEEDQLLSLTQEGGRLRIADDEVLTSRTVSGG